MEFSSYVLLVWNIVLIFLTCLKLSMQYRKALHAGSEFIPLFL